MMDDLFTDGPEFLNVVRTLRTWDPELRHLALYASLFWDDARIGGVNQDNPPKATHLN